MYTPNAKPQILIGKEYPQAVIPLINNAKKSIEILMFDWRWYKNDFANPMQQLNHALITTARRGVQVSAITNYNEVIDTLKAQGVNAMQWPRNTLLHSKLIVIDRQIVVMGSHNFTSNAFTSNLETSTILFDEALAISYSDFFRDLCQSTQ